MRSEVTVFGDKESQRRGGLPSAPARLLRAQVCQLIIECKQFLKLFFVLV